MQEKEYKIGFNMSDKEIIKKLYTNLCESSITKDFDKLNEILGTNYVLSHMTGMTQSKEEYIKMWKWYEIHISVSNKFHSSR